MNSTKIRGGKAGFWSVIALTLVLAGCALKPKFLMQGYTPPRKVAVLPMANQSNDMKGPEYVRQEFIRMIEKRGYTVMPATETDEMLRTKLGVTEGGQMNSTTPQKAGEALGVDAVVYGDLINFKFLNIGFYQNKLVEANFRMMETKSGQALWEDQRKASRKQVQTSLKGAGQAMAGGLVEKAVGNMLGVPLYEQVQAVVRMATSTLPKAR